MQVAQLLVLASVLGSACSYRAQPRGVTIVDLDASKSRTHGDPHDLQDTDRETISSLQESEDETDGGLDDLHDTDRKTRKSEHETDFDLHYLHDTDRGTTSFSEAAQESIDDSMRKASHSSSSEDRDHANRSKPIKSLTSFLLFAMVGSIILFVASHLRSSRGFRFGAAPSRKPKVDFAVDCEVIEFEVDPDIEDDFDRQSSVCGSYFISDPLWQGHLWKLNSFVTWGDLDNMSMLDKSWFRRWFLLSYGKSRDSNSVETRDGLKLYYYSEKDDALELFCCIHAGHDISEAPGLQMAALGPDAMQHILRDTYGYDIAFMVHEQPFATYDDWCAHSEQIIPKKLFPILLSSFDGTQQRVLAATHAKSRKAWFKTVHRALGSVLKPSENASPKPKGSILASMH